MKMECENRRRMRTAGDLPKWLLILTLLHRVSLNSASESCRLSFLDRYNRYTFSLTSPTAKFPHGVLSEDGFYKVAENETVLWFQLCDGMIFNHNPPRCTDCWDCGGPSHCGMNCSALVSENIEGYPVCTTIGHASGANINLIDTKMPNKGVIVKMWSNGPEVNCSLSVSVICKSNGIQEPHSLEKSGTCDFAIELRHPSGCAEIVSIHGSGLGWLGTFIIILFSLLGAYLLVGAVYRFFFLGVRGIDIVPNLGFWTTLPQRTQSSCSSLVRKFRGPSEGHRSSYSPVNF